MYKVQATRGSWPLCAAKAMGTLQPPNEIPRYNCGSGKTRLTKGYETVRAPPMADSLIVRGSSSVTRYTAMAMSTPNSASASSGDTRRAASGRSRVRRTCGSMSRSAKSLMTHPAARITQTPSTKMISTRCCGRPEPAIHSAHSAGHSSSQVPMGRSSRASCAYSSTRRRSRKLSGACLRFCSSTSSRETATIACLTQSSDSSIPLSRADPSGRKRGNIIRVRGEQQLGRLLHSRQHIRVPHEIGHAQLREPCLTSPEQLARTAQLQIPPRDLEPVVRLADRFEPLARQLRQRCAVEQHARACFRAASDAPAKLMQLGEPHALRVFDHHQSRV